jgi:hypothetical protein
VIERAVRMVFDAKDQCPSQWAADFTPYVSTWQGFVSPSPSMSSRGASPAGASAVPGRPTSYTTRWSRRCTRGGANVTAPWCTTATAARIEPDETIKHEWVNSQRIAELQALATPEQLAGAAKLRWLDEAALYRMGGYGRWIAKAESEAREQQLRARVAFKASTCPGKSPAARTRSAGMRRFFTGCRCRRRPSLAESGLRAA